MIQKVIFDFLRDLVSEYRASIGDEDRKIFKRLFGINEEDVIVLYAIKTETNLKSLTDAYVRLRSTIKTIVHDKEY